MPIMWGVDMSQEAADRLKLHCAMTPALAAEGWADLDSAPKDGTEVELRVVHINAAYDDPEKALANGWIAACQGKWIDHNGGGWTWHGLCGSIVQWRPAPPCLWCGKERPDEGWHFYCYPQALCSEACAAAFKAAF